ncbi:hypothetical protein C8Q77DRAFT_339685 [Trametes polyzona]|nr:hypothetical protein C8Q77DRAFT_339685 [Trametes polyzona]
MRREMRRARWRSGGRGCTFCLRVVLGRKRPPRGPDRAFVRRPLRSLVAVAFRPRCESKNETILGRRRRDAAGCDAMGGTIGPYPAVGRDRDLGNALPESQKGDGAPPAAASRGAERRRLTFAQSGRAFAANSCVRPASPATCCAYISLGALKDCDYSQLHSFSLDIPAHYIPARRGIVETQTCAAPIPKVEFALEKLHGGNVAKNRVHTKPERR